jgi:hypothetical protein
VEWRVYLKTSGKAAHQLEDIGRKTAGLYMNHATFEELRLALAGEDGRKVIP